MSEPRVGDRGNLLGEDYRQLFEELPAPVWVQDLSRVKQALDELGAQGITNVRAYLQKNPGESRRFVRLVGVLRVNRRTVDLFKAGSEADLLSGLDSILFEEALPGFAEQVIAVAEGQTRGQVEGPSRTLSGEPLDIVVRWSVVPGHEATYDWVVVSMIDVTALRKTERELRASEPLFRGYFERAMIGMATISRDKKWLEINAWLSDILGYTPRELQGTAWLDITHPEDRQREEAEYDRIISGEIDGYSLERRFICKDGQIVEAHVGMQCIRGDRGEMRSCVALVDDVTHRQQMGRKILALNTELEGRIDERTAELRAAVEQLESFAYSIAHDLRTPLRAMDGYSAALLQDHSGGLDESGLEYVHKVRDGAQHMASLIDNMLALARASSESMRITDVDLSAIARFVVANLRGRDPRPGVHFTIPDNMRAHADPGLVAVVLQNLLDNAWKYTADVEHPRIELGAIEYGERVYFVKDNGIGFDAKVAGRLFTPFDRVQGRLDFEAGTGMGLATVEKVVKAHGGRCWADGSPGGGATFYFTLAPPPKRTGGDETDARAAAVDVTA